MTIYYGSRYSTVEGSMPNKISLMSSIKRYINAKEALQDAIVLLESYGLDEDTVEEFRLTHSGSIMDIQIWVRDHFPNAK